jgi:hypothetical protein
MQTPVACTHPANCQGEEGTCSQGYDGPLCEYCASGYYTQAGQCLPCGDSTDQRGQIISALVAACVVMAVLGGLVAFLASMNLALAVSSFLVLQQLAMVGLDGSKELPVYRTEVGRFFTWLNLSQQNQNINASQLCPAKRVLPCAHFDLSCVYVRVCCVLIAQSTSSAQHSHVCSISDRKALSVAQRHSFFHFFASYFLSLVCLSAVCRRWKYCVPVAPAFRVSTT